MTNEQIQELAAAMPADKLAAIDWAKVISLAKKILPIILALLEDVAPAAKSE